MRGNTTLLDYLDIFGGFLPQPRLSGRPELQPGKEKSSGSYAPLDERTIVALNAKASGISPDNTVDLCHPRILFDQYWKRIKTMYIHSGDSATCILPALPRSMLVATLRLSPEDIMDEIRRKLASEAKRLREKKRLAEMEAT